MILQFNSFTATYTITVLKQRNLNKNQQEREERSWKRVYWTVFSEYNGLRWRWVKVKDLGSGLLTRKINQITGKVLIPILLHTWSLVSPFLPCLPGVFMNRGKMVRRPRISTNLLQLSAPSGPVSAWSSTLSAPLRDSFFSLTGDRKVFVYKHYCVA